SHQSPAAHHPPFHTSRITHYALRITHHALRITHHASRITHYASRITHYAKRSHAKFSASPEPQTRSRAAEPPGFR
ncbi:MAG: hypothetical protein KDE24_08690, partial [Caldilinea sp.]|nr:hypothetical protein [Caldilinea sp.]